MQLGCNRHWVSGARRQLPCVKCAQELAKKNPVDTKVQSGHFFKPPPPVSRVAQQAAPRGTEGTTPQAKQPPSARAAFPVESMPSVNATQLQKRRDCRFCRKPGLGVVWGMETCRECGARLNEVADRMRTANERGTL